MVARITDDAVIVDIEIELPDGSTVWLEPQTGLNVIYGKNGSGKTSFLQAITSGHFAAVIYLKLTNEPPVDLNNMLIKPYDIILWAVNSLKHKFASAPQNFYREVFLPPTASELWSQIDLDLKRLRKYGRQQSTRFARYRLSQRGKHLLSDEIRALSQNEFFMKNFLYRFGDIYNPESVDEEAWINLGRQLAISTDLALVEINDLGVIPRSAVHDGDISLAQKIQFAVEQNVLFDCREEEFGVRGDVHFWQHSDTDAANRFRESVPYLDMPVRDTLARLLTWYLDDLLSSLAQPELNTYLAEEMHWFEVLRNKHGPDFATTVEFERQTIRHVFSVAVSTLLDDKFMAIVRDPNFDSQLSDSRIRFRTGLPHYAIRLPDSPPTNSNSEVERFFSYVLTFLDEFPSGTYSSSGIVGAIYLSALGEHPYPGHFGNARPNLTRQRKKYLRVGYRKSYETTDAPGIVDLDTPVDLSAIASALLEIATSESSWMISPPRQDAVLGEVSVDLPMMESVQSMIEYASKMIRAFDIGISALDFDLKFDYESVRLRTHPEIRFRTREGSQSIRFEELSSAQKRWTTFLFNILLNEPSTSNTLIFVADEPDSGVHQSASREILEFLASLPCTSLITSHSPTSLRIESAHLMHLSVASDGERTVSPPALSKTVAEVAADLGVSPIELLALRRLLVVCEGEHDIAVIEGLIKCSKIEGIQQRIIVAAANGVANLQSIAACSIITDYTDLKVLHVADNSNIEELRKISDYLRSCPKNMAISKALRGSGIAERRSLASPEDLVMLNILEAIAKRRLLSRFHLFGLRKKDIIEYLPEDSFGLTDSWTQLRSDYFRFKAEKKLSFKDWLRAERSAQISTRKVREAFNNQEALNAEFRALLDEIESLALSTPVAEEA